MLLVAANTFFHYVLHSIDLRSEDPWENKTIYMRYVDIGVGERSGENLCYTVESFLKRALCCDLFGVIYCIGFCSVCVRFCSVCIYCVRFLFCVYLLCQVLFCVHLLCQVLFCMIYCVRFCKAVSVYELHAVHDVDLFHPSPHCTKSLHHCQVCVPTIYVRYTHHK